jgi:hypothetical protein
MATLGLKEMGKFLWEGKEKVLPCWLSQFSFANLRQPTGQNFFSTFHTSSVERFSENFDDKVVTYLIFFLGTH